MPAVKNYIPQPGVKTLLTFSALHRMAEQDQLGCCSTRSMSFLAVSCHKTRVVNILDTSMWAIISLIYRISDTLGMWAVVCNIHVLAITQRFCSKDLHNPHPRSNISCTMCHACMLQYCLKDCTTDCCQRLQPLRLIKSNRS